MQDYVSLEQLEHRLLATKAEIRQVRRKILLEMIGTSCFLLLMAFFWRVSVEVFALFTVPLIINVLAWLLWIAIVLRRALRTSPYYLDEEQEFAPDEYRAQRFYLARLNRQEAIFDVLTGVQFSVVSLCFVVQYFFFGWWW